MALRKTRPTPSNASVKAFVTAAESYVEQTFQRFPSYGSSTGRHEFDAELERPTLALFRAHEKLLRETLAQIESLPEVDFRGDAWLDRRALLAELRTEVWSMERGDFRKNPERWASGALGSVHGLVVKHADDLKPVASAIFSRVQKLPAYLASSAEMLDAPIPVWTRMAEMASGPRSDFPIMPSRPVAASIWRVNLSMRVAVVGPAGPTASSRTASTGPT